MKALFSIKKLLMMSLLSLGIATPVFAAQDKLTLMLDWFVNPNHGPIVIAEQKGIFKQLGLEVEIQEPSDPTLPPKLVAAGKIDMAITYQPNFIIDLAEGLPLQRSSTLIATPLNTILVLDNGKINSIADLKDKTVGIAVAGTEEAMVGTMLKSAGLSLKDIKLVNVGWNLSSSLASGKVDAIWGGLRNFETNQLALEGVKAKAFYPEEYGVPSYEELIFVVNKKKQHSQAVKKFNQALTLATQYIVNHPEEAWQEFKAYRPDSLDTELNQRAWLDTLNRFALRPAAKDEQGYQAFADFMLQQQLIKRALQTADYL